MVMEEIPKTEVATETPAEQKKDCPTCELETLSNGIMMAVGTANQVCQLVENPVKKEECTKWAQSLNPTEVKKAKDVYRGILQHTDDIDKLDQVARTHNAGLREAIIEEVTDRLEKGIPVPDKMMKAYKEKILNKRT